jgi:hypothetical protein
MGWNYRVMRHHGREGLGWPEAWLGLHETYYSSADVDDLTVDRSDIGCTACPGYVASDSLEELRWHLEEMLAGLSKPVFDYGEPFDPEEYSSSSFRKIIVRAMPSQGLPAWDYRVVREPIAAGGFWFAIHEINGGSDAAGHPEAGATRSRISEHPICPCGETVEDLRWILERMLAGLDRPALEHGEIIKQAPDAASLAVE